MSSSFSGLGVPAETVASLAARGITGAFPIQTLAIPPALAGRDVVGRAPTGSGKTIAFGIPLAQRVGRARPGRPRALVLAPTRELAAQIHEELTLLLAGTGRRSASFYGGVGFGAQLKALRQGVDVIVACPGRLADLINRRAVALDDVDFVVIDEADRMADMGFLPEVRRLLDQVRPDRQTLLFSATLDGDVDVLIRRYQNDPFRCEVESEERHIDLVTHRFVSTKREDRVQLAADFVARHGSTIVFCRTKHGTDRVARQLKRAGVVAVPIHGGRSQGQRDRALAAFSAGKAQALVATDVAARGIHVDDVACVVHFDPPADHKDYVHRSGRTGRAGAEGTVVTFVTDADADAVRKLRRALALKTDDGAAAPDSGASGNGGGARWEQRSDRPPRPGRSRRPNRDRNGRREPNGNRDANRAGEGDRRNPGRSERERTSTGNRNASPTRSRNRRSAGRGTGGGNVRQAGAGQRGRAARARG